MHQTQSGSSPDSSAKRVRAHLRANPTALLMVLLATIFGAEAVVMMALGHFDSAHAFTEFSGIHLSPRQHYVFEGLVDGLLLTLVVFPVLYCVVFRSLSDKNQALADSEARLDEQVQDRTRMLNQTVNRLNRRQNEMLVLDEIIHQFQACETTSAIFQVIEAQLGTLFPDLGGNLILINEDEASLGEVFSWGDAPVIQQENLQKIFEQSGCKIPDAPELVSPFPSSKALPCESEGHWRLRLPLRAQTKGLGFLCMQAPVDPTGTEQGDDVDRRGHFWSSLAESLAMSINNLKLRSDLSQQALRDPLTGLYNRRYLADFVERELGKLERSPGPLSVMMIDIDHFKRFNDTYGHAAGDTVLVKLAMLLNSWVRRGDIVTRSGGEEFVAVLPGADAVAALHRADDLRRQIEALTLVHEGLELGQVTVSIGVSVWPVHGSTEATLIEAADSAMYASKQAGRNRVTLADAGPVAAEESSEPARRSLG